MINDIEIFWNNRRWRAIRLAGGQAIIGLTSPTWDYKKNPYGPGTIAYLQDWTPELIKQRETYFVLYDQESDDTFFVDRNAVYSTLDENYSCLIPTNHDPESLLELILTSESTDDT